MNFSFPSPNFQGVVSKLLLVGFSCSNWKFLVFLITSWYWQFLSANGWDQLSKCLSQVIGNWIFQCINGYVCQICTSVAHDTSIVLKFQWAHRIYSWATQIFLSNSMPVCIKFKIVKFNISFNWSIWIYNLHLGCEL